LGKRAFHGLTYQGMWRAEYRMRNIVIQTDCDSEWPEFWRIEPELSDLAKTLDGLRDIDESAPQFAWPLRAVHGCVDTVRVSKAGHCLRSQQARWHQPGNRDASHWLGRKRGYGHLLRQGSARRFTRGSDHGAE